MKAIGIILAGGNNKRMKELSYNRAIAAMPMVGTYRSIDFALSNMSNSRIQKVAVLTQYNTVSLNEHLNSSKWWDFGRKQGGLYVFTPTITAENSNWYRGTADALYQNLHFLKRSHEPYVVLASGDGIYKLDYNKVLEYHIQKRADITVVCKEMPEGEDLSRFGQVKADDDGRIRGYEEKPMVETSRNVSCGIYVIRRRLLIELIERAAEEDRYDLVKDILIRYKDIKRIYAYQLETYWSNISSVEAYYRKQRQIPLHCFCPKFFQGSCANIPPRYIHYPCKSYVICTITDQTQICDDIFYLRTAEKGDATVYFVGNGIALQDHLQNSALGMRTV